MGKLNRLLTKSWKVENRCLISSSDTLKPSSTLTAMVNDNLWLSLQKDAPSVTANKSYVHANEGSLGVALA